MMCDCYQKVDEKLKPKGFKLASKLFLYKVQEADLTLKHVMVLPVERLDGARMKRGDPKTVEISYCPFCGKKQSEKSDEQELTPAEKAKGRSANYHHMSAQEQWDEDKRLGILDWDGK